MDEPSQDTLELATELFDSRARLKSELRAGEGSGIWGSEMNTGGILFLQTLAVAPEWRGKGIGRDIMEAFMKKGQSWKDDVQSVLLKPGQLNTMELNIEQEGMSRQQVLATIARDRQKAIAFWRALGFRRIASSEWFATTFDPLHPVHQLAAEDDYDTSDDGVLGRHQEGHQGDGQSGLRNVEWLEELGEDLRLRVALVKLPDAQCLELWQSSDHPQALLDPDSNGNNILHIAAMGRKPRSLSFILDNVLTPAMKARFISGNNHGQTPQNILIEEIEGNTPSKSAALECFRILQNEQRSTNGCTCGQCLDGFFSPRMKVQMSYQAERLGDMVTDSDAEYHSYSILDRDVKKSFKYDAELREGYSNVFRIIASCLESGHIPYSSRIIEEAEHSHWNISYFTDLGGEVETVLAHCLRDARIEASDHGFYDVYKDDLEKLPECDNDGEFEQVAELLGLNELHMRSFRR
ncbi:uncharacterized protein PAC_12435 [Phialocephala subalpina]|uniref:N-acetyltransferase domain-containing protein n=1 Tax=Phialocephala subalpina TaxID=576137 RepID=A0A1L7XBY8_9HELO|nr:uncharacterized protein PAC_12435 [Phialocephala subalpina]